MLVITYALLAYAFAAPFVFISLGMKINQTPEKEVPIFNIPKPKKKPKMTPEQDRLTQILTNIDNYNGTTAGQEKIKHG